MLFEHGDGLVGLVLRDSDDHADAAVEGTPHLRRIDTAVLGEEIEDGSLLPARRIDLGVQVIVQHARNVLGDAAAGDVGDALDRHGLHQREYRLHVDPGRGEQTQDGRLAVDGGVAGSLQDFANQRIAVRMGTAGREADQRVACADLAAVDDLVAFDDTDAETGQIVIAIGVHVGHFRSLAADQRGAGLQAALGDTRNDVGGNAGIELAAGEVVEEKQRFRALRQHVIDAHCNEVDADRVVPFGLLGEHQLGADTVRARHQNRFAIALRRQREQPAEAADAGQHFRPQRAPDQRLDAFHEFVARVDIDAGVLVG